MPEQCPRDTCPTPRGILFDDATGSPTGIPLSEEVTAAVRAAGLPLATPPRGENGRVGDFKTPGTTVANVEQQKYFADVATEVVLPMFKSRNKPWFWSIGCATRMGRSMAMATASTR